ncbi:SgrR family transcriptional regulator [Vibrio sp. MA40-2]|uniref:SgrR family transcriptional regulator n=1 Tax=Vibrio sp. MA40-2 TaxID=3391828 RepID=UPI0039A5976F
MSSPRLRTQFEILFDHFNGKNSDIQLDEIVSILFCTRRNARIVLNKMSNEGWIEWHPAAGRGNLSTIIFKRNQQDVSENLAKKYLDEGRIERAFSVLNEDTGKLTKVIEDYLGVTHREGRQIVRLPYYRQLSMLNPVKLHRRSEQNIIRQIFSGLTKLNLNEELQPDLAHTWESVDGKMWRFYLRSGVRFHNGNLLTIEHVIDSIRALAEHAMFDHVQDVSSPLPWVIDIQLSNIDWHLPLLLTETRAKIMPPVDWRGEDFDLKPIGTGPYKVKTNDDKRLVLEAFDSYFGYRALIDRVEVWVIDEVYSAMVFPSLTHPIQGQQPNADAINDDEVKLDPGCTFLLLNRNNGLAKDDQWALYFCSTLTAFNLFRSLDEQTIIDLGLLPAYGLKPGWQHAIVPTQKLSPPINQLTSPTKNCITIAYHSEHPVFPELAKKIGALLNKDGLSVEFVKYQHYLDDLSCVDIWLKPMGIGTNRDDALVGWLMDYSHLNQMSDPLDYEKWCKLVYDWRENQATKFDAKTLGKQLVQSNQIIPLFHCWLGVNRGQCGTLQNATCNALGWFDFSEVWVKPE